MKRALVAALATVAGTVWLLLYKPSAQPVGSASAPPPEASSPPSPSPGATPAAGSAAKPSGTFTGNDYPNRFGDVQVQVILVDGHITDVQAVRLPTDRALSAYISQQAGPILRQEVVQAQSAQIDGVSGATYTSYSYSQSVQSALKQAGH